MSQKNRILIVVGIILVLAIGATTYGLVLQSKMNNASSDIPQPNMIHLYVDGKFVANVSPADLNELPAASFTDAEEGKLQEGWWLHGVARLYVNEGKLTASSEIEVAGIRSTTGETKSKTITWEQATEPANNVIFDLSGDGQALKLVSTMPGFDIRDTWIQGINRIDVRTK
jgi:hypothetical protein